MSRKKWKKNLLKSSYSSFVSNIKTYSRGIYVLECVSVLSNHKLIHHPMYTHRLQLLSIHKTELNMNLLLYGMAYGIQWLITTIIIIIKYWFVFGCFFRTITDDISDRCHHNHPFDMKRMFFFSVIFVWYILFLLEYVTCFWILWRRFISMWIYKATRNVMTSVNGNIYSIDMNRLKEKNIKKIIK